MSEAADQTLEGLERFGLQQLRARLDEAQAAQAPLTLKGLAPGAKPFAVALLRRALARPVAEIVTLPTRNRLPS